MDARQFGSNNPTRAFARQARRSSGAGEEWVSLAVLLLLMVPFMLWSGFVLEKLWAWFAVPLGAPAIGLGLAVGVNLLVNFFLARPSKTKADAEYLGRAIGFGVFEPVFALGIGYIVHLCIT